MIIVPVMIGSSATLVRSRMVFKLLSIVVEMAWLVMILLRVPVVLIILAALVVRLAVTVVIATAALGVLVLLLVELVK